MANNIVKLKDSLNFDLDLWDNAHPEEVKGRIIDIDQESILTLSNTIQKYASYHSKSEILLVCDKSDPMLPLLVSICATSNSNPRNLYCKVFQQTRPQVTI